MPCFLGRFGHSADYVPCSACLAQSMLTMPQSLPEGLRYGLLFVCLGFLHQSNTLVNKVIVPWLARPLQHHRNAFCRWATMLQNNQVAPLLHHTMPSLDHVSFRLSIDVNSTPTTPAAAAAAAGTALLTSVGNLLTRPRRTLDPRSGNHARVQPEQSTSSMHVPSAQGTVSTQSAQDTGSTQSALSHNGHGGLSAMRAIPVGTTINR